MNYSIEWQDNCLLSENDAVKRQHIAMCLTLDCYIRDNVDRVKLLHGEDTDQFEQDQCYFDHGSHAVLNKNSKVIITTTGFGDVTLSPSEFFYYVHIAYKRFISRDNRQAEKNEFTAGMEYFRNTCKIKCVANGNPILEGYPRITAP